MTAQTREVLPVSASATLDTLMRRGFATSSEVVTRTTALLQGPDRVRRWRRAATIGLCGLMPAGMGLLALLVLPFVSQVVPPDVTMLNSALIRLSSLASDTSRESVQERAALEAYVASQFRPLITDPHTWTNPFTAAILGPRRPLAERAVAEHPNVSTDELARATSALGPFLHFQEILQRRTNAPNKSMPAAADMFGIQLTVIALFGMVWAFVLRGGLFLRACGIAIVTRDGRPASRLRTFWRGLVAWSLVPAAFWFTVRGGLATSLSLAEVAIGLFLLGAAWALVQPTRGVQDRLAGAWLVPQ